jgi:hypothetical protein
MAAVAQATEKGKERSPLTEDEQLGMKTLPHECAKYGYENVIRTLWPGFFDVGGINHAITHLIEMGETSYKGAFWDEMSTAPSRWYPSSGRDSVAKLNARLDDEVTVCFKEVEFRVKDKRLNQKPWYRMFREFLSQLEKHGMSDTEVKWFYGNEPDQYSSSDFNFRKRPYQASVSMFDGALEAFSCFVNGEIKITAWTHDEHPKYDRYGHRNFGVWKGKLGDFLERAKTLQLALGSSALDKMSSSMKHCNTGKGTSRGEVKLFHPELGMIAMRPEPIEYMAEHRYFAAGRRRIEDPATLVVNSEALEKMREALGRGTVF